MTDSFESLWKNATGSSNLETQATATIAVLSKQDVYSDLELLNGIANSTQLDHAAVQIPNWQDTSFDDDVFGLNALQAKQTRETIESAIETNQANKKSPTLSAHNAAELLDELNDFDVLHNLTHLKAATADLTQKIGYEAKQLGDTVRHTASSWLNTGLKFVEALDSKKGREGSDVWDSLQQQLDSMQLKKKEQTQTNNKKEGDKKGIQEGAFSQIPDKIPKVSQKLNSPDTHDHSLSPTDEASLEQAEKLRIEGQYELALAHLQQIQAAEHPQVLLETAENHYELGHLKRCIESLKNVRDPRGLHLKAMAREGLEDWANAEQAWAGLLTGTRASLAMQGIKRCRKMQGKDILRSKAILSLKVAPQVVSTDTPDNSEVHARISEHINSWSKGKETNLRALLTSLHSVLPAVEEIKVADVLTDKQVRAKYLRVAAKCHPDKLHSVETEDEKMTTTYAFYALNKAWAEFQNR